MPGEPTNKFQELREICREVKGLESLGVGHRGWASNIFQRSDAEILRSSGRLRGGALLLARSSARGARDRFPSHQWRVRHIFSTRSFRQHGQTGANHCAPFRELQQRNVFRVAIGYSVSSWLLIEVADVVLDNIGSPDWVMQTIMLLLALGFPVAVVFSWVYQVTPEGIKRESQIDCAQSINHITGRKLDRAIVAVLVIALVYFAYDKFVLVPQRESELVEAMKQAVTEPVVVATDFALALEPVVPEFHYFLGRAYLGSGRLDKAEASFRKTLDLSPTAYGNFELWETLFLKGELEAALAQTDLLEFPTSALAITHYALGNLAKADEYLAKLIEFRAAYAIARVYGYRGEADKTFEWLNYMWQHNNFIPTFILGDPALRSVYSDPRWQPFLEELGLLEFWLEMPPKQPQVLRTPREAESPLPALYAR